MKNTKMMKMNLQMFARQHENTTNFADGDVFDPEVLAEIAQAKYDGGLKFLPLAEVDTKLVGIPGSTITIPKWKMMGDVVGTVEELGQIPVDHIEHEYTSVTIKKVAKGFEISDEAQLLGYGDPKSEGMRQLGVLFPKRLNQDCLDALLTTTNEMGSSTPVSLNYDGVCSMADKFIAEDDHHLILFLNPKDANTLRRNMVKEFGKTDRAVDYLIDGTMMDIDGVEVVKTIFMPAGQSVMVMAGSYENEANNDPVLKVVNKTPIKVELDRDKGTQKDIIYYSTMYGVDLYNEARALKAKVAAPADPVAE